MDGATGGQDECAPWRDSDSTGQENVEVEDPSLWRRFATGGVEASTVTTLDREEAQGNISQDGDKCEAP